MELLLPFYSSVYVRLEGYYCIINACLLTSSPNEPLHIKLIINKKAVLSQRWPRDARYISRSWGVAEIWPFEIIQYVGAILNLFESKIAPLDPPSPKTPPYNQTWSGSDDRLRRYGHLKFRRHLGFVRTGNSAIRSAVPEYLTLEQNMTWIGRPVAEISPLEIFPTWRWPPSWICSNRK